MKGSGILYNNAICGATFEVSAHCAPRVARREGEREDLLLERLLVVVAAPGPLALADGRLSAVSEARVGQREELVVAVPRVHLLLREGVGGKGEGAEAADRRTGGECAKGGKHVFRFAKCMKCGESELPPK